MTVDLHAEAARIQAVRDVEPWPALHRELADHEALAALLTAEIRARQAKQREGDDE